MVVPHPIPYQGSKRLLAPHILALFPPNTQKLIEPFAGSAAISLAALQAGKTQSVLLNDIDKGLMRLWEAIIHTPEQLAQDYEQLWHTQQGQEREFYNTIRCLFNQTKRPDYFLFLLIRCVKAAVRYNAQGEFNQSPDNRRKGTHPATLHKNLLQAARLLASKNTLYAEDYRSILEQATPQDLIYLDPPYQGVSHKRDSRYHAGVAFSDLVATLQDLNKRQLCYLLSYDGRTGQKQHGWDLPHTLQLHRVELLAGRSSQATLLNRSEMTYEALYLSPALQAQLKLQPKPRFDQQLPLFEQIA